MDEPPSQAPEDTPEEGLVPEEAPWGDPIPESASSAPAPAGRWRRALGPGIGLVVLLGVVGGALLLVRSAPVSPAPPIAPGGLLGPGGKDVPLHSAWGRDPVKKLRDQLDRYAACTRSTIETADDKAIRQRCLLPAATKRATLIPLSPGARYYVFPIGTWPGSGVWARPGFQTGQRVGLDHVETVSWPRHIPVQLFLGGDPQPPSPRCPEPIRPGPRRLSLDGCSSMLPLVSGSYYGIPGAREEIWVQLFVDPRSPASRSHTGAVYGPWLLGGVRARYRVNPSWEYVLPSSISGKADGARDQLYRRKLVGVLPVWEQ